MKTRLPVALSCLLLSLSVSLVAGCSALDRETGRATASGSSPSFPTASEGEFSVMTFNLHCYRLQEPGPDSDSLDPRPPASADALANVIRQVSPDILAVQEMGDPAAWAEFKYRLRQAGLEYRYEEYLPRPPRHLNLAVLSRFPIVGRASLTNDIYTIGPTKFPVQRGFIELDIEITPAYRLRLINAHLKSKAFHEYGQAEMRRNEARLLGNHVRRALDENPHVNLLVVGTLNDAPGSRSMREIYSYQGTDLLFDLRPADSAGDAWTLRTPNDTHHRSDYMFTASGLLNETLLPKTYAVRSPLLLNATDHRPLVATFVAREQDPAAAPDLSARHPPEFTDDN